jgi:hypothetical protein
MICRSADPKEVPNEAEIAAVTVVGVCEVTIGKPAKLLPAGILTDEGTVASGLELDMSIDTP